MWQPNLRVNAAFNGVTQHPTMGTKSKGHTSTRKGEKKLFASKKGLQGRNIRFTTPAVGRNETRWADQKWSKVEINLGREVDGVCCSLSRIPQLMLIVQVSCPINMHGIETFVRYWTG